MRKASIKLRWKQTHLDELETLGWSPSVKLIFSNLQQLHSIVGSLKQPFSNMGYTEKLHWNFSTFRNVWVNYKSFIQIWIKSKSFGYMLTILMKFEQIGTTMESVAKIRKWRSESRPVTRGAKPTLEKFLTPLEKCVGHSLKILGIVQQILAPLGKLFAPPGVPSWLRPCLNIRSVRSSKSLLECSRSLCLLLALTQKRWIARNSWNPTWLAGTGLLTATGKPTKITTIKIFDKTLGLRFL